MRKLLFGMFALSVSFVASEASASPSCQNLVGKWTNQLGSTMTITSADSATGKIEGTYRSPSGGGAQDFPLIGWTNVSAPVNNKDVVPVISFSVRWGNIYSITAWSGTCRLIGGTPTILSLWHLARSVDDFEWGHIRSGADNFTPTP